jgi:hypothetical protein
MTAVINAYLKPARDDRDNVGRRFRVQSALPRPVVISSFLSVQRGR